MHNTPEVESLQKNNYFVHNKTITAGHCQYQNHYCKQLAIPKIVNLVSTDQRNSKLVVKIGFTNFKQTEPSIFTNR
jgi:hypothetical protein